MRSGDGWVLGVLGMAGARSGYCVGITKCLSFDNAYDGLTGVGDNGQVMEEQSEIDLRRKYSLQAYPTLCMESILWIVKAFCKHDTNPPPRSNYISRRSFVAPEPSG